MYALLGPAAATARGLKRRRNLSTFALLPSERLVGGWFPVRSILSAAANRRGTRVCVCYLCSLVHRLHHHHTIDRVEITTTKSSLIIAFKSTFSLLLMAGYSIHLSFCSWGGWQVNQTGNSIRCRPATDSLVMITFLRIEEIKVYTHPPPDQTRPDLDDYGEGLMTYCHAAVRSSCYRREDSNNNNRSWGYCFRGCNHPKPSSSCSCFFFVHKKQWDITTMYIRILLLWSLLLLLLVRSSSSVRVTVRNWPPPPTLLNRISWLDSCTRLHAQHRLQRARQAPIYRPPPPATWAHHPISTPLKQ